jgi:hypothetical protein
MVMGGTGGMQSTVTHASCVNPISDPNSFLLDAYCDNETTLYCRQQPVQATKDWDVFSNNPPIVLSGSMADQTCMQLSLKIIKILAYVLTFIIVLGGAVLSKGTMLFMTSQLRNNKTLLFCNATLSGNYEISVPLP